MTGFSDYARYLQQPLTLIGFVLLLVFGVHRALLRSGIVPPLTQRGGSRVVHSLLRYGFIIAIAILILGFALEFFKTAHKGVSSTELGAILKGSGNAFLRVKYLADFADLANQSDDERQKAVAALKEIEEPWQRAGIKLSPENLTGLGYLFLSDNQPDKAETVLLEAIQDDKQMGPAYFLLATVTQLQANEHLQKGDVDRAREILGDAIRYAGIAEQYYPSQSSNIEAQLGYIEKDLAQHYLDKQDKQRADQEIASAKQRFQMRLGVNPDDPGALNGLGDLCGLTQDFDCAIREHEKAIKAAGSGYTYAWCDLAKVLQQKYLQSNPPDRTTLAKLNDALDHVFDLQATPGAQRLQPAALSNMQELRGWARAEAGDHRFADSDRAIQAVLSPYREYLRALGAPTRDIPVLVMDQVDYVSGYIPAVDTILVSVKYADNTIWPLRDYTMQALLSGANTPAAPAVAVLSGLGSYYPCSYKNDPTYAAYYGSLDAARPFSELKDQDLAVAVASGASIWGSIFWELRKTLGQSDADRVLFATWKRAGQPAASPTYAHDFAAAILNQHKSSGGAHGEDIRLLFARRGLQL